MHAITMNTPCAWAADPFPSDVEEHEAITEVK